MSNETHICQYCKAETSQPDEQCYVYPNKQTAVEWLVSHLNKQEWFTFKQNEYIEQAKAMEKEQMKEMYLKGIENYNPTFKKTYEQ